MPRDTIPSDAERCTAHVNDGTFQGHRYMRARAEGRDLCKQHLAGEKRSQSLADARAKARAYRQQVGQDLAKTLGAPFVADFYKDEVHISLVAAEALLIRIKTKGMHIDA